MKKILLFTAMILISFVSNAQFEVRENSTNNLIPDGGSVSFSEAGCGFTDSCNWKFSVTNTSSEDIYMRIFVDELVGTDGSDFQLCFAGVCLNNISLGSGYPTNPVLIAAGASNSVGNNLWNQNASTTTTPMSWTFRFQPSDVDGNAIGSPLTMTYNFDPSLSVDLSELEASIKIFPMVVKNHLNVSSREDLKAVFYDLLGKKIKQINIDSGDVSIDVSSLSAQTYIILFSNNEGKQITKKIVKQ